MANTKTNQTKSNKSGKNQSKTSQNKNRKRNASDDTMKFLLVLVIAGIAIALIVISQSDDKKKGNPLSGTPTPGITNESDVTPAPTGNAGSNHTESTSTPQPDAGLSEVTSTPLPTPTPTLTSTPTPTPTPTPAVSAEDASKAVSNAIGQNYEVLLINDHLHVGNDNYYQFGVIKNQEFLYPFLVVNMATGTVSSYNSEEGTVFDFTVFPLEQEVQPTAIPTQPPAEKLTAKQAYEILCTYSKETLKISKEVAEYDAEYDNELTLIDGVDCYRINLSEISGGKVRNRGEFYVSVDGEKCYYIDNETNEFVLAQK